MSLLLMGTMAAGEASQHPAEHSEAVGTVTREYLIGPIDLPAHTSHAHNLPFSPDGLTAESLPWYFKSDMPLVDIELDADVWLVGFSPEIINGKGEPLPGGLLCHTVLLHLDQTKVPGAESIVGSGGELYQTTFPTGYGIRLSSDERLQLLGLFRNPFAQDFGDVYLKVTLRLLDGEHGSFSMEHLKSVWFSVLNPERGAMYTVPPGVDVRQRRVSFPFPGRVVYMMGHLHPPYGVRLQLDNLTTGETVWVAQAERSPDGRDFRFPRWSPDDAFNVSPTEEYLMTAEYDNVSDDNFHAMGVLGAFVLPEPSDS